MNTTVAPQDFIELHEMKEQLHILQEKIQKEVTINNTLIQESMKHKMSWNKKLFWMEVICAPFEILAWFGIVKACHLSWWTFGFFTIMLLVCLFFDYIINLGTLRDEDYQRDNLIETSKKLVRMKHLRRIEYIVTYPLGSVWLGWAAFEMWQQVNLQHNEVLSQQVGIVYVVLIALAAFIVFYLYYKRQRTNDELIEQINSVTTSN